MWVLALHLADAVEPVAAHVDGVGPQQPQQNNNTGRDGEVVLREGEERGPEAWLACWRGGVGPHLGISLCGERVGEWTMVGLGVGAVDGLGFNGLVEENQKQLYLALLHTHAAHRRAEFGNRYGD